MLMSIFTTAGVAEWGLRGVPTIPDGMPVLIDDDLVFEDDGVPRPSVYANRWLRDLPVEKATSPHTWTTYARVLRDWMEFLAGCGYHPFDGRDRLRSALSEYAIYRRNGSLGTRFANSTWNLHISVLTRFYEWACDERLVEATPFTFSRRMRWSEEHPVEFQRNNAKLPVPKAHSTIKYLESDFVDLLLNALGGEAEGGSEDKHFRGRHPLRNSSFVRAVIATGLRRREFTYLLVYEIPALPPRPTLVPIRFPVPHRLAKGSKPRTTWIDHSALEHLHNYIELERNALQRRGWDKDIPRKELLHVEEPDPHGALIDGARRSWSSLRQEERLRLVSPEGFSCILALQSDGSPFQSWPSVLTRASRRIRKDFDPRFPDVSPHMLRHTFAMRTLERLVDGYFRSAAALVTATDADAALEFYLHKHDPLAILRDLLGHSSVTTTETYLRRLDVTRVYRSAYENAGLASGLFEVDCEGYALGDD